MPLVLHFPLQRLRLTEEEDGPWAWVAWAGLWLGSGWETGADAAPQLRTLATERPEQLTALLEPLLRAAATAATPPLLLDEQAVPGAAATSLLHQLPATTLPALRAAMPALAAAVAAAPTLTPLHAVVPVLLPPAPGASPLGQPPRRALQSAGAAWRGGWAWSWAAPPLAPAVAAPAMAATLSAFGLPWTDTAPYTGPALAALVHALRPGAAEVVEVYRGAPLRGEAGRWLMGGYHGAAAPWRLLPAPAPGPSAVGMLGPAVYVGGARKAARFALWPSTWGAGRPVAAPGGTLTRLWLHLPPSSRSRLVAPDLPLPPCACAGCTAAARRRRLEAVAARRTSWGMALQGGEQVGRRGGGSGGGDGNEPPGCVDHTASWQAAVDAVVVEGAAGTEGWPGLAEAALHPALAAPPTPWLLPVEELAGAADLPLWHSVRAEREAGLPPSRPPADLPTPLQPPAAYNPEQPQLA